MTVTNGSDQATFAATLVDEWVRGGVTDVVVAPGSRSTPLALAVARDGRVRVHVHLDERVAGFFALGLGLATGRPAVVVTTSGTAAVELHPSVVEASQGRVPLIVCTADRPAELHHVNAPQTVEQGRLFGDGVRWFVEPGTADGLPREHWRSIASRMVVEAMSGPTGPGPVHANLAFRDPLVAAPGELPPGRPEAMPWHRGVGVSRETPVGGGGDDESIWSASRGVFVAGAGAPLEVARIAETIRWPIFADPRSGLRGTLNAVAAFDSILRSVHHPTPDCVVRVGAAPASKVLSQWLAALPASCEQVIIDPYGAWPDPERRASLRLPALPRCPASVRDGGPWLAWWLTAESAAQAAIDDVLGGAGVSEPGVIRSLTRDLPSGTALFASSSMPIRDLEWFGHPSSRHLVFSNRGANGIDGVVATSLGVAAADSNRPVVAVVGDLAFLYDSSALLWAASRDVDLTIVVLDNDGGGIFSFLPQRADVDTATFEQLFGTPHGVDLSALAAVHGIPVIARAGDGERGVRMVHVRTDRDDNVALHAVIHAAVAEAVAPISA